MTTNLCNENKPELYRNLTDTNSKVPDCTCTLHISNDMEKIYRCYFSEPLKVSDDLVGTQHRVVITRAPLQSPTTHLPERDSPAWLPSPLQGIVGLFVCLLGHPSGE